MNDSVNVAATKTDLASTPRSCGRLDKSDFDYKRDYSDEYDSLIILSIFCQKRSLTNDLMMK